MAKRLTFRGATLKYFDVRQSPEGGNTFLRLHFEADLSKPVSEEMGWGEIADGCTSGKLEGELIGQAICLIPADKAMANLQTEFAFIEAKDFQFVVSTDKDSGRVEKRVRFVVRTAELNVESQARAWMHAIGLNKSLMKVSCTMQPTQPDLPLSEKTEAEVSTVQ